MHSFFYGSSLFGVRFLIDVFHNFPRYISKILEAVSLILSLHWHRIESNMEPANIILFVSSFYKLSFHVINRQSYRICLDIWYNFLEYLNMRDVIHKQQ